jgi:hypothetical protein
MKTPKEKKKKKKGWWGGIENPTNLLIEGSMFIILQGQTLMQTFFN